MTTIAARATSEALSEKLRNAGVMTVIFPNDIEQDDHRSREEADAAPDGLEPLEPIAASTLMLEDGSTIQLIDMATHARLSEEAGHPLIVPRQRPERYFATFYLDRHDLSDDIIAGVKGAGFAGIVLDVAPGVERRLIEMRSLGRISRHVAAAQEQGLTVVLAGNLEEPDVPRLLPLNPDYIVLDIPSEQDMRGRTLDVFFRSQNVVMRTRQTGKIIIATVSDMSAGIRAFGHGASYVAPGASDHFSIGFPYNLRDAKLLHVSVDQTGQVKDGNRATIENSKVTFPIAFGFQSIPKSVNLTSVMHALKEQGFVAALFSESITDSKRANDLALDAFATAAHAAGLKTAIYIVPGERSLDPATTVADCLIVGTALPNKDFNTDEITYWVEAAKPRTDRIFVRDILVDMQIGAYGFERGRTQRVRFSVEVEVDRPTGRPEEMDDIYSYDMIMDGVRNLVERGHTDLVETLAEDLSALVLQDPRVHSTIVKVEKLDLGPGAVGIEIRRP